MHVEGYEEEDGLGGYTEKHGRFGSCTGRREVCEEDNLEGEEGAKEIDIEED